MAAITGMENGRAPWGEAHHDAYRKLFCHRPGMMAICEDLPEEHNTVTLGRVLKDSSSIPAPWVDYAFSENSRHMLDHAVARRARTMSPVVNAGWHLLLGHAVPVSAIALDGVAMLGDTS
jgi:hypothetical protein